MDPELLTPMYRRKTNYDSQDYYIFEPAYLHNSDVCMPLRWYTKLVQISVNGQMQEADIDYVRVCSMTSVDKRGWLVNVEDTHDIPVTDLRLSFPRLREEVAAGHFPKLSSIPFVMLGTHAKT